MVNVEKQTSKNNTFENTTDSMKTFESECTKTVEKSKNSLNYSVINTPLNPVHLDQITMKTIEALKNNLITDENLNENENENTPLPRSLRPDMNPTLTFGSYMSKPDPGQKQLLEKEKEKSDKAGVFQYSIIKDMVEQVVFEYMTQIRADIRNLHLDILRLNEQNSKVFM